MNDISDLQWWMEDKLGVSFRLSVELDLTKLPVLIAISAKNTHKKQTPVSVNIQIMVK